MTNTERGGSLTVTRFRPDAECGGGANDAALLAAAMAANGGSAVLAPGASVTFT